MRRPFSEIRVKRSIVAGRRAAAGPGLSVARRRGASADRCRICTAAQRRTAIRSTARRRTAARLPGARRGTAEDRARRPAAGASLPNTGRDTVGRGPCTTTLRRAAADAAPLRDYRRAEAAATAKRRPHPASATIRLPGFFEWYAVAGDTLTKVAKD